MEKTEKIFYRYGPLPELKIGIFRVDGKMQFDVFYKDEKLGTVSFTNEAKKWLEAGKKELSADELREALELIRRKPVKEGDHEPVAGH
jgi:hypothetical protein